MLGTVFADNVTVFSWLPTLPLELNWTDITPVLPGAMGSFEYLGTVHPQLPWAELIIRGAFPVFVNMKSWSTKSPSLIGPKFHSSSSNEKMGSSFLEKISDHWITRLSFVVVYSLIYLKFTTANWQYALLPIHFVMGPLHGSIVNWCGHRYGYINDKKTKDNSKNTLPVDFLMMGELFQNNHHSNPSKMKFSRRWFELDPGYIAAKILSKINILRIKNA